MQSVAQPGPTLTVTGFQKRSSPVTVVEPWLGRTDTPEWVGLIEGTEPGTTAVGHAGACHLLPGCRVLNTIRTPTHSLVTVHHSALTCKHSQAV